ncbi:MAG TPA: CDP-alcohol phosphatidyltransferase family protein [Pseudomonadales bacterium]
MNPATLLRQLPNAVTLGNGFCGLAAVLLFMQAPGVDALAGTLDAAFLLIALGVLCDTLDGPLARVLKANDPLGAQLDSLCDGATFGVATALVVAGSFWTFSPLLAGALAAWWLAAVLVRLARFNLDTDTSVPHLYFSGMCSPVAALFVVAALAASAGTPAFPWLPIALALLLPALMLSRLVFADLPKHYLARRRSPLDLAVSAIAMFFLPPASVVALFLTAFTLQTAVANARGKHAARA